MTLWVVTHTYESPVRPASAAHSMICLASGLVEYNNKIRVSESASSRMSSRDVTFTSTWIRKLQNNPKTHKYIVQKNTDDLVFAVFDPERWWMHKRKSSLLLLAVRRNDCFQCCMHCATNWRLHQIDWGGFESGEQSFQTLLFRSCSSYEVSVLLV